MHNLKKLQSHFKQGGNLSQHLKREFGITYNNKDVIELSYDIMAGSYYQAMSNPSTYELRHQLGHYIASKINHLGTPERILEAGVGEASTMTMVLRHLHRDVEAHGIDISWSRLGYAKCWLDDNGCSAELCRADMEYLPYADNSFDIVYTVHAVEPNGTNEKAILSELLRVTAGYLVLIEPDYNLADEQAKQRMDDFGYCKNLTQVIHELGFELIEQEATPDVLNPQNPTSLFIVAVEQQKSSQLSYLCPNSKTVLTPFKDCFYSSESMYAYPIIGHIPCLRREDAIIASHYQQLNS